MFRCYRWISHFGIKDLAFLPPSHPYKPKYTNIHFPSFHFPKRTKSLEFLFSAYIMIMQILLFNFLCSLELIITLFYHLFGLRRTSCEFNPKFSTELNTDFEHVWKQQIISFSSGDIPPRASVFASRLACLLSPPGSTADIPGLSHHISSVFSLISYVPYCPLSQFNSLFFWSTSSKGFLRRSACMVKLLRPHMA